MHLLTFTGAAVDPRNVQEVTIRLRDIAHALAMTCRFGGHCKQFYSVAEHSIHVMLCVRELAADESPWTRWELERAALMHDAAEAYVGDLPTPFKKAIPGFKVLEKQFERRIRERFELWDGDPRIKQADRMVLASEAEHLLPGPLDGWADHDLVPWLNFRPRCWAPESAEQAFLYWSRELGVR